MWSSLISWSCAFIKSYFLPIISFPLIFVKAHLTLLVMALAGVISFWFSTTFIFSWEALTDAAYSCLILSPSLQMGCVSFPAALSPVLGEAAHIAFCCFLTRSAGLGFNHGWTPPPPCAPPLKATQVSPVSHCSQTSVLRPQLQGILPWPVTGTEGCAWGKKEEGNGAVRWAPISSAGTRRW